MNRRIFLLTLLAAGMSNAYAVDIETDFAEKLVDAVAYTDSHQADVWPGFHLSAMSLIGHFGTGAKLADPIHAYAFNFQPKKKAWKLITIHQQPVYFLDKDIYNIGTIGWGVDPIDGQPTFIRGLDHTGDGLKQAASLITFRFFYNQHFEDNNQFGKQDPWSYPIYAWGNQVEHAKLNLLEIEALKNYLQATNSSDKQTALKDAIALNISRSNMPGSSSDNYDQFISLNWGLANYVAWKSLNISNPAQYLGALTEECDISSPKSRLVDNVRACQYYYSYDFTAVAYGAALDEKMGNTWKPALIKANSSPHQMAVKLFPMSDEEVAQRVKHITDDSLYNSRQIDTVLNDAYAPYIKEAKLHEQKYQELAGTEFELVNNDDWSVKLKKQSKMPLQLHQGETSDYEINNLIDLHKDLSFDTEMSDGNRSYSMHVNNIPYLYHQYPHNNFGGVWQKFKISPETRIVIDGKSDTVAHVLSQRKQMKFNSFALESSNVKLSMANVLQGEMDTTNGKLVIKFRYWE